MFALRAIEADARRKVLRISRLDAFGNIGAFAAVACARVSRRPTAAATTAAATAIGRSRSGSRSRSRRPGAGAAGGFGVLNVCVADQLLTSEPSPVCNARTRQ